MTQRDLMQRVRKSLWTLTAVVLWLGLSTIDAQAQEVDQARSLGGTDAVYAVDVAIDETDNLYITGNLWGDTEFGSVLLGSAGGSDIFIAKYDAQGNNLWAQRIGGNQEDEVASLAIDQAGNSYITGHFYGTTNVGPLSFTNADIYADIFIAKYDSNGNFIWAKQIHGDGGHAVGEAVSVDSSGNLYVAGTFEATVDFGTETLTTTGEVDSLLAKYDSNGDFLWVRQASGSDDQRILGVAADDDTVFVTGFYEYVVSFGIGTSASRGSNDAFLTAYASDGTLLWVGSMGGGGQDTANDVVLDNDGNIITTGAFEYTADFGPITVTSVDQRDGFVAKFSHNGAPLWVQPFGGAAEVRGDSLAIDSYDNVYVTGPLGQGQALFGSHEIAGEENSSFVASFDSRGNVTWARHATSPIHVGTRAIDVDSNGYLYAVGDYQVSAYFGSFTLVTTAYFQEAFITRWTPPPANDLIFSDNFEVWNFSAWTNYSSDLGDLSVTTQAALVGSRGLQAVIDDNTPIGVRDELPNNELRYLVRFRFDPNSLSMAQNENHVIFFGYSGSDLRRPVLRLEVRHDGNFYQLRAALLDDDTTWRASNWKVIGDEPTRVALEWYAATGDGTNNGSLLLRFNDQIVSSLTDVDNDTRRIDTVRLGAIAGIDNETRGAYYFDGFESRRLINLDPTMVAIAAPSEVTAWTEVDESEPEEAALMQEVLEYAEQAEQEKAQQESPPTDEEQIPQLFLPYLNRG